MPTQTVGVLLSAELFQLNLAFLSCKIHLLLRTFMDLLTSAQQCRVGQNVIHMYASFIIDRISYTTYECNPQRWFSTLVGKALAMWRCSFIALPSSSSFSRKERCKLCTVSASWSKDTGIFARRFAIKNQNIHSMSHSLTFCSIPFHSSDLLIFIFSNPKACHRILLHPLCIAFLLRSPKITTFNCRSCL